MARYKEYSNFQTFLNVAAGELVLTIYGVIGDDWYGDGTTAKDVVERLDDAQGIQLITVNLNSTGGDLFDSIAIYNVLARHQARVVVNIDAAALSAASVVAMAGDEINMAENALLMIHSPWAIAIGTADELREQADMMDKANETLVKTYAARSKLSEDEVRAALEAETWYSAEEAVEAGLADSVTEAKRIAAMGDPKILERFRRAPSGLSAQAKAPTVIAAKPQKSEIDMDAEERQKIEADAASKAAEGTLAADRQHMADLKAAFPDDLQFAMDQFTAGHTVTEAKAAFTDVVVERNAAQAKKIVELEAKADAAGTSTGVEPLVDGKRKTSGEGGDFMETAQLRAREDGCTLQEAKGRTARENPDLYAAHRDSLQSTKDRK